jgi:hypothetical protein
MMERWTDLIPDKEKAKTILKGVMPIGCMGTADEDAGAIFFLASAEHPQMNPRQVYVRFRLPCAESAIFCLSERFKSFCLY